MHASWTTATDKLMSCESDTTNLQCIYSHILGAGHYGDQVVSIVAGVVMSYSING